MENEGGRSAMNNPGAVIENFKAPRIGTRSVGRRKLKLAPLISRFFVEGDVGRETMRNGIKRGTFARIFLFPMKTSSWHWSTGVPFPIGCLNLWPFRAQKHARIISIVRGSQLRSISVLVASIDRSSVLACVCVCMCIFLIQSREKKIFRPRFSFFLVFESSSLLLVEFSLFVRIYIYNDLQVRFTLRWIFSRALVMKDWSFQLLISHRRDWGGVFEAKLSL